MVSVSEKYANAHAHPQGPGDARPSAMQIIEDEDMVGKLAGKNILITGASSGIGIETARALHATGAKLFLPVRNLGKAEPIREDILKSSPGKGEIIVMHLDLEDLDSVRACANEFLAQTQQLNILVNNAGIMAVPERRLTKQGHELQFGTNHLAHFLLFQLFKDALLRSSTPEFPSKVVNVSSSGHRGGPVHFEDLTLEKTYTPWAGYAQAKLSNVWMANYIDRHYGPKGIHALSLMPGGIATGLQVHVPEMKEMMKDPAVAAYMKSPEQGASTTVWAAIGTEWRNKGGKYLEDVGIAKEWDPASGMVALGYAETAYQPESEEKLWKVSCTLVGVPEDA